MPKNLRTLALGLVLLAAVSAAAVLRPGSGADAGGRQEQRAGKLPVADYDAPEAARGDQRRKDKSARFNRRNAEPITEHPVGVEELPLTTHWWSGLSALPVAQSSAVVVGQVTDARAFMSADKTGVYSEFTVGVEEVLKGDASLAPGSSLTADRRGGGVRFRSGRVQRHVIAGMRMPVVGARYVLFLKAEGGQDYSILTGYELHDGVVSPLDGPETDDARARLPFSAFEGKPEADFLQAVREAVSLAAKGGDAR